LAKRRSAIADRRAIDHVGHLVVHTARVDGAIGVLAGGVTSTDSPAATGAGNCSMPTKLTWVRSR
jgi:hypothetical protein